MTETHNGPQDNKISKNSKQKKALRHRSRVRGEDIHGIERSLKQKSCSLNFGSACESFNY
jgi:hypothetical protein